MLPLILAPLVAFLATIRTAAGRDWQARIMGNSGAAGAGTGTMRPADFIALSETSTAPTDASTSLTGELTDSGLARSAGTFAHTAGASSYTVTRAFTSGGGNPTRTIRHAAVFNASSGGTMPFAGPIPDPPPISAGDQITVTQTVSLT